MNIKIEKNVFNKDFPEVFAGLGNNPDYLVYSKMFQEF